MSAQRATKVQASSYMTHDVSPTPLRLDTDVMESGESAAQRRRSQWRQMVASPAPIQSGQTLGAIAQNLTEDGIPASAVAQRLRLIGSPSACSAFSSSSSTAPAVALHLEQNRKNLEKSLRWLQARITEQESPQARLALARLATSKPGSVERLFRELGVRPTTTSAFVSAAKRFSQKLSAAEKIANSSKGKSRLRSSKQTKDSQIEVLVNALRDDVPLLNGARLEVLDPNDGFASLERALTRTSRAIDDALRRLETIKPGDAAALLMGGRANPSASWQSVRSLVRLGQRGAEGAHAEVAALGLAAVMQMSHRQPTSPQSAVTFATRAIDSTRRTAKEQKLVQQWSRSVQRHLSSQVRLNALSPADRKAQLEELLFADSSFALDTTRTSSRQWKLIGDILPEGLDALELGRLVDCVQDTVTVRGRRLTHIAASLLVAVAVGAGEDRQFCRATGREALRREIFRLGKRTIIAVIDDGHRQMLAA